MSSTADVPETKTYTMSMTKANKVLTRLREKPEKGRKSRYSSFSTEKTYSIEINLLSFKHDTTNDQLKDIQEKFNNALAKKTLVEKWKNRLFELNVRYGLHAVMSSIDMLKEEKSSLNEILTEHQSSRFIPLEQAVVSMKAVESIDKKYDFKWQVSPFNVNAIKKRVADINKQISKLEDERDNLNIQNSFSIELTAKEREFADLE